MQGDFEDAMRDMVEAFNSLKYRVRNLTSGDGSTRFEEARFEEGKTKLTSLANCQQCQDLRVHGMVEDLILVAHRDHQ